MHIQLNFFGRSNLLSVIMKAWNFIQNCVCFDTCMRKTADYLNKLIQRPDEGGSTRLWNVVTLQWDYRRYIPEDSKLYSLRRENLKSHILSLVCSERSGLGAGFRAHNRLNALDDMKEELWALSVSVVQQVPVLQQLPSVHTNVQLCSIIASKWTQLRKGQSFWNLPHVI
jgi:hypothetical protein